MKIQRQKLIFSIIFVISIILAYLFWGLINLKFKNPDIIGQYSINNYNAANDILRYLFFLIIPCAVFLIYKYKTQDFFFYDIKSFLINSEKDLLEKKNFLVFFFLAILIFVSFEFLSIQFPIHKIDSYHEGQKLSAAYNYFTEKKLWSGSYITVGIYYEAISSSIFWKLFNHTSISLSRFGDIIYIFVFKILFIISLYLITKLSQLEPKKKVIFFILNSIIFISLIDYRLTSVDDLNFREIPIIILLILFTFLLTKQKTIICILLISVLSPASMFWGVDRGLVCNILILVIFTYLFLSKRKKESLLLFSFTCLFWFFSYLYLGEEFKYFLNNTFLVFKEMSYVHGLIHPKIFSDDPNSARASKTIILILINLLISISLFFKKNYPNNFSKIIIFLSLISMGSYLYALGRSDGAHIKNSFGFPLMTFLIFISYIILKKYSKKLSSNKSNIAISLLLIFFIFNLELNIKNTLNFSNRLKSFIYLPDNYFLNDNEKNFVNFLKPKLVNLSCIQLFTNDAVFNYLLRKNSCTKYYFVWSAASKINQNQFITELSKTNLIITGGEKNNWDYPLEKKLHIVHKFILEKYELKESFKSWSIFIKK